MRFPRVPGMLLTALALLPAAWGQTVIKLDAVIGAAGTDAFSVQGNASAVNLTGIATDGGVSTLTASGSTGSSSFNFNTGFGDSVDRTVGGNANSGTQHVIADRGYDSANAGLLKLDKNNDGSFADEVDSAPSDASTFHFGFGLHADGFITFDLAVIRTNNGLAANTAFTLTGGAGVNYDVSGGYKSSGAIVLDSTLLAVFDWETGVAGKQFSSYSLSIPGSARYLTFAGLAGLDGGISYDHLGFSDVQLTAVPEPAVTGAAAGLAMLGWAVRRRRATGVGNADLR